MIIKLPLYLESDRKLTPGELNEVLAAVQLKFTQELIRLTGGYLRYKILKESKYSYFSILTKSEVETRIISGKNNLPESRKKTKEVTNETVDRSALDISFNP